MPSNHCQKVLDEDAKARRDRVLELVCADREKIPEMTRKVILGGDIFPRATGARVPYLFHIIPWSVRNTITSRERAQRIREVTTLEKMFGRKKAERMRLEAELLDRNAPPSSR